MASLRKARKQIDLDPTNAEAWFTYATALAERSKDEDMHQALIQALGCRPSNVNLALAIGLSFHGINDRSRAIAAYRWACTLAGDHPEAFNRLGDLLLEARQFPEARSVLRKAVHITNFEPDTCLSYAIACLEEGDAEEALTYAYRVSNDVFDGLEAYRVIAEATRELGLHASWHHALQRTVELAPGDLRSRTMLGVHLSEAGRHEEAISHLRAVAEARPHSADAFSDLGMALLRAELLSPALHMLQQATRLEPNVPEVLLNLGVAQLSGHQLDDALETFFDVVRLAPSWGVAHYNVGLALKAKGELAQAVESFRQAQELMPEDPDVRTALTNTLVDHADEQRASGAQEGRLDRTPLSDLIDRLGQSKFTGMLTLNSAQTHTQLQFLDGFLIGAVAPGLEDIVHLLVSHGAATSQDVAIMKAEEGDKDPLELAIILIEDGLVSRNQLDKALRAQIRKSLEIWLDQPSGEFSVHEGPGPSFLARRNPLPFTPIDGARLLTEVLVASVDVG